MWTYNIQATALQLELKQCVPVTGKHTFPTSPPPKKKFSYLFYGIKQMKLNAPEQ